jgi:hypothetical protein
MHFFRLISVVLAALTLLLQIGLPSNAAATEVSTNDCSLGRCVSLVGAIERGDTLKLIDALLAEIDRKGPSYFTITIDSPGGDAVEAMKLGELFHDLHLVVMAQHQCDSACVLAFLGAGQRGVDHLDGLGVHRPHFDSFYFASLDSEQAQERYQQLETDLETYFTEMNTNTSFKEEMMNTPSDRLLTIHLTLGSESSVLGESDIPWDEWLAATCGSLSTLLLQVATECDFRGVDGQQQSDACKAVLARVDSINGCKRTQILDRLRPTLLKHRNNLAARASTK